MKGILIVSHSLLAKGLYESAKLFVGNNVKAFDYLGLESEDDPAEFGNSIKAKINELDQGEGVIILADLLGGTPANQSMRFINDKTEVITGVNLPMVLDVVLKRNNGIDVVVSDSINEAKSGIVDLKVRLAEMEDDDEED